MLHVSESTLVRLNRSGAIPAMKVGKRSVRIDSADVDATATEKIERVHKTMRAEFFGRRGWGVRDHRGDRGGPGRVGR